METSQPRGPNTGWKLGDLVIGTRFRVDGQSQLMKIETVHIVQGKGRTIRNAVIIEGPDCGRLVIIPESELVEVVIATVIMN